MNVPKVLIIGQPFNNDTGGGITLTNLFKGWDRNRLAVACQAYLLEDNIDTHVCNTYYQLGEKEHKWRFPFNLIQRRYPSGIIRFSEAKVQNLTTPKSKVRVSLIMKVLFPVLDALGLVHAIKTLRMSEEFCKWLDEYQPDIIYAQTTSLPGIRFCLQVESYLRKPMVFHMMDDWPATLSETGLFKNYWRRKIDQEFRLLLDRSALLMSISEEMTAQYKRRYNKEFVPFQNAIDIDFWKKFQRSSYDLSPEPELLYAGRIGLGIDSSLELIAQAVERVNQELGLSLKFVLQTKEKPAWLSKYKNMLHRSFVAYDDLPQVFAESDFLILPYDFSASSVRYISFSMPTKAPEYMMSGTPVIILAPEQTAVVKYARKYEWAKVVTENKLEAMAAALKQMILDQDSRRKYAANAIRIAEGNHNSEKVRNDFQSTIQSVVVSN